MMEQRPKRSCRSTELNAQQRKQQKMQQKKMIKKLLEKAEPTEEEKLMLSSCKDMVTEISKEAAQKNENERRKLEIEDDEFTLHEKCKRLCDAMRTSKRTVVYTGAGVSTAANIPDYRGPEGVWTLLKKGERARQTDVSAAHPTYTHMALVALHRAGYVSHVVSQNCDGLHFRSGLPREALSEIHGNMYMEVCSRCGTEYVRSFDVTGRTALRRHSTGRQCVQGVSASDGGCGGELRDTIVHFGETGRLPWPLNWAGATRTASAATLILCLGTSLKVLKAYKCLWPGSRGKPKLMIVNLQWTPKDKASDLKINGRCDDVMRRVMQEMDLQVDEYKPSADPIFNATEHKPSLDPPTSSAKHEDETASSQDDLDGTSQPITTGESDLQYEEAHESAATGASLQCETNIKIKIEYCDSKPSSKTAGSHLCQEGSNAPAYESSTYPVRSTDTPSVAQASTHNKFSSSSDGASSAPGWFGKGIRQPTGKRRKKISKLQK